MTPDYFLSDFLSDIENMLVIGLSLMGIAHGLLIALTWLERQAKNVHAARHTNIVDSQ